MNYLEPWQLLLWIVGLTILVVPIIAAGVTMVIDRYFRSKQAYYGRIARAFAKALDATAGDFAKAFENMKNKMKNKETEK